MISSKTIQKKKKKWTPMQIIVFTKNFTGSHDSPVKIVQQSGMIVKKGNAKSD